MKIIVSESLTSRSKAKARAKGNPRSKFFSKLMKELAGDTGNEISQMYVDGKSDALRQKLLAIVDRIAPAAKVEKVKV
jgi:hypothetical protein